MNEKCDQYRLLVTTRSNLTYVVACVLQIKTDTAADYLNRAGNALLSKMAAAGVTVGLYGLVSTFGVASTGTAIATLSGAAQTSATLYAIGTWVGGTSVAAGTMLTGGIGLVTGLLFYQYIKSSPREEESLTDLDRRIINTATYLSGQIDQTLEQEYIPTDQELAVFFDAVIEPFYRTLKSKQEDLSERLDARNRWALKVNAVIDFEREVIEGFRPYVDRAGLGERA